MHKTGWTAALAVAGMLFVSQAPATLLTFDDLNTSAGDLPISGAYQGFDWQEVTAYQSTPGFTGFNAGIVSPGNAIYGGAEDSAGTGSLSHIQSATVFDFASAYVGAGYYDGLAVTFRGLRNGAVAFTRTVTVDTNGASNQVFNFTGIDALEIFSKATGSTSDPFACGIANCAYFTLDNVLINETAEPPASAPPTALLLLASLLGGFTLRRKLQRSVAVLAIVAGAFLFAAASAQVLAAEAGQLRVVPGLEEPLIATDVSGTAEEAALNAAIRAFTQPQQEGADFAQSAQPFLAFLEVYPHSPWRLSLLTNLGIGYYQAGYFSTAFKLWQEAWETGRTLTAPQAKAQADRAVGELARMHARIGAAEALEKLFAELGNRAVSGPATEMITGAREGLWFFRNEPGISYLCGPKALQNLLISLNAAPEKIAALNEERSGPHGYSLEQVSRLATAANLPHRLIYRTTQESVPVPSIINWKLNHYAAIVGEEHGRYHIQDPTFASGDLWVTRAAIDQEASGYFLVPESAPQQETWRTATAEEVRNVYGMGNTTQNQPGATTDYDKDVKPGQGQPCMQCPCPMCAVNAKTMVVSLALNDIPVGYQPPIGPSAKVRITYYQREASQPSTFSFFNVGPKWTLNFMSWVQDNPAFPGFSVQRYAVGGGSINYATGYTYNSITGAFSPDRQGQAVLIRIPATGPVTSYELRMPDGSKQVFAQPDGATSGTRRVFLTQIVDSAGNALILRYDNQLRLNSLTDATGRSTTFSYGRAATPLLVTRITDPFGRHADLTYDAQGRLTSITDVIGITSSFTYDAAGLVNGMTTPYGTHRFAYGDGSNNTRFLEMTDPLGLTERLEFIHFAPGIAYSDPVAPKGLDNFYLYYRNTFHWDKHVYPLAVTKSGGAITREDYTKAHMTHWLHNLAGQTSPIVESVKPALENRTWFTYPGQSATYVEGGTGVPNDAPTSMSRILDDGSTQASRFTYNALGKPLTAIDPLGRKSVFTYDATGIDLLTLQQQTAASGTLTTIASFTYNSQHRPLTYTDAAGQTTRYAYNTAGQLTAVTNPLSQTTRYEYDGTGNLIAVTNANGKQVAAYSYDGFNRVAVRTDSEGHTTSYSYDALDRVTDIAYPDGTHTLYEYDRLDLARMTDRQGRVTEYSYDANRQLTAVTDPLGQTTRYAYYENGVLKSLTDPKGNITSWDIDIQSRVTAKHFNDGTKVTTTYENRTSRVKAVTDALGQSKQYGYALDNRLTTITYASALNPTPTISFTYDGFFPRVSGMKDGTGTTSYSYHPPGVLGALQLAGEDGPFAHDEITYQHDALGRVTQRKVGGNAESWGYDAIGRATSHSSDLGAFNLGYLGETGQRISRHSATLGTDWRYEENLNDRRLKSINHSGSARDFDYSTSPENLISKIVESVGGTTQRSWDYQYDASDRLTQAAASTGATHRYGYDAADNLTTITDPAGTRSINVNALNQITSVNGAQYRHDANGNLLEDESRTYKWDAENRLIEIGYKAAAGKVTQFRYDGLGRRTAILEMNGTITAGETRFTWCGESLCQGRSASDAVTRRYVDEGEVRPVGGEKLYYATDHLGSVRDVLAVNGSKVASYDYDPYGSTTTTSGRVSTDFRYAGMFLHQPSGLYLTHYRAYDPKTGRWLSRDPIEEAGGLNLYAYVGGNTVNAVDPTGEIALLDNVLGGIIGVEIGYGISRATCEEYGVRDFLTDFALGFATDGLASLAKLRKLRNVEKAAAKAIPRLSEDIARTFAGGKYSSKVLQQDVVAYRYSGGVSSEAGRFLTTRRTVGQIGSPSDATSLLNLPPGATAEQLNAFVIPRGTRIFYGRVAGGGDEATQIFIENPAVLRR